MFISTTSTGQNDLQYTYVINLAKHNVTIMQ